MKKIISIVLALLITLLFNMPVYAAATTTMSDSSIGVRAYIVENGQRIPLQNITVRKSVPTDFSMARTLSLNNEDFYEISAAIGINVTASGTTHLQDSLSDADYVYYAMLYLSYKDAPGTLAGDVARVSYYGGQYTRRGTSSRIVQKMVIKGRTYGMDLGPNGTNYESGMLPTQYDNQTTANSPSSGTVYKAYPTSSNYFWVGAAAQNMYIRTQVTMTVANVTLSPIEVEIHGIFYGD